MSLILLHELMTRLGVRKGLASLADLRLSNCFDLIVGTGTGSISALFLGHMHMTIDKAIVEYLCIANAAFNPCNLSIARNTSSSEGPRPDLNDGELECSISNVANRFLRNCDAALEDSSSRNPRC